MEFSIIKKKRDYYIENNYKEIVATTNNKESGVKIVNKKWIYFLMNIDNVKSRNNSIFRTIYA